MERSDRERCTIGAVRTRIACLAVTIALAISLAPPTDALAKGGCCSFNGFRVSGGNLPHPVTIPLEEVLITTSGLGSWYAEEPVPLTVPPAGVTYRVEILGVDIDQEETLFDELYVAAPEPLMTTDNGALWGEPAPEMANLLDRYIAAGEAGVLSEKPSFGEALRALEEAFGVQVVIDGETLSEPDRSRALSGVSGMTAVSFGVQANLVGQRDLSVTPVEVRFREGSISLSYVPPGIIAPFGLLMIPRTTQTWGYTSWIDPPGYSTLAFTVRGDFDEYMESRGAVARTTYEITQARAVPVLEAIQYEVGYERAEVTRDGRDLGRISADQFMEICEGCGSAQPMEPFSGESVSIAVWPKGSDPFPEAVKPIIYTYYTTDASRSGRGVLVTVASGGTGNVSLGGFQSPVYATKEIDREIASLVSTDQGRDDGVRSASATAAVAMTLAVLLGASVLVAKRMA